MMYLIQVHTTITQPTVIIYRILIGFCWVALLLNPTYDFTGFYGSGSIPNSRNLAASLSAL
jgi:hypothetical protein